MDTIEDLKKHIKKSTSIFLSQDVTNFEICKTKLLEEIATDNFNFNAYEYSYEISQDEVSYHVYLLVK